MVLLIERTLGKSGEPALSQGVAWEVQNEDSSGNLAEI